MPQIHPTQTLISKLRLTAKVIHKNLPEIAHYRALDLLAQSCGFQSWHELDVHAKVDEPQPDREKHPWCLPKDVSTPRRTLAKLWIRRSEQADKANVRVADQLDIWNSFRRVIAFPRNTHFENDTACVYIRWWENYDDQGEKLELAELDFQLDEKELINPDIIRSNNWANVKTWDSPVPSQCFDLLIRAKELSQEIGVFLTDVKNPQLREVLRKLGFRLSTSQHDPWIS